MPKSIFCSWAIRWRRKIYPEYAGLSQKVASLIEAERIGAEETKDDILWRVLSGLNEHDGSEEPSFFSLGQGIEVPVGERLYLFLTKPRNASQKPDGIAEIRSDGLYLSDSKVEPSHGSVLAPAMQAIQKEVGHYNDKGALISLSAYRQWYVVRGGELIPLDQLKDPKLKRTRTSKTAKVDVSALLRELGIE